MKITNTGDTPIRLAADPRLVSLEIGAQHCIRSARRRPAVDRRRQRAGRSGEALVVDVVRSALLLLHAPRSAPRFVGRGDRPRALGTGWKPAATKGKGPSSSSPPYVATPVGAAVGKVKAGKRARDRAHAERRGRDRGETACNRRNRARRTKTRSPRRNVARRCPRRWTRRKAKSSRRR